MGHGDGSRRTPARVSFTAAAHKETVKRLRQAAAARKAARQDDDVELDPRHRDELQAKAAWRYGSDWGKMSRRQQHQALMQEVRLEKHAEKHGSIRAVYSSGGKRVRRGTGRLPHSKQPLWSNGLDQTPKPAATHPAEAVTAWAGAPPPVLLTKQADVKGELAKSNERQRQQEKEELEHGETLWVGALPLALAQDEPALHALLAQFGTLESLTIRVKDGKHYGSWCMASYARVDGGQKSVLERALAAPIPVPREPGHALKKATKVIAAARAFNTAGAAAQAAAADDDEGDPEPVLLIKAADVKGQMKKKAVEGTVGALAAQAEIHEEKRRSLREQLEENLSEAQKAAIAKQFAAETKKTSTRERSRLRRFASRDGSVTSMFSSLDSQRNRGEPKEEAQTSAVGRPKARVQLFWDKT